MSPLESLQLNSSSAVPLYCSRIRLARKPYPRSISGPRYGVNKLKDKFKGPYQVVETSPHGQNVGLDLPEGDRRHPVFHISKVKPFVERGDDLEVTRESDQQK